jgi:hypothetical protein
MAGQRTVVEQLERPGDPTAAASGQPAKGEKRARKMAGVGRTEHMRDIRIAAPIEPQSEPDLDLMALCLRP